MTVLERILATPCPDCAPIGLGGKPGGPCYTAEYHSGRMAPMVCASRIQAAEGAEPTAERECNGRLVHDELTYCPAHDYSHVREVAKPARSRRHDWRYLAVGAACNACGTRRKSIAPMMFRYSHDNGATWTPGPDACQGRRP